jgi:hypothetical protein
VPGLLFVALEFCFTRWARLNRFNDRARRQLWRGRRSGRPRARIGAVPLQPIGELDGKIDAFADQARGIGVVLAGFAQLVECFQQPVKILRQKFLAEIGIAASPLEIALSYQVGHRPACED